MYNPNDYQAKIEFVKDVDGNEGIRRSSNIKEIAWAGASHPYPLRVTFFPWKDGGEPTTYIYAVNKITLDKNDKDNPRPFVINEHNASKLWTALSVGAQYTDQDPSRRSTGRAFDRLVKKTDCPYVKVQSL